MKTILEFLTKQRITSSNQPDKNVITDITELEAGDYVYIRNQNEEEGKDGAYCVLIKEDREVYIEKSPTVYYLNARVALLLDGKDPASPTVYRNCKYIYTKDNHVIRYCTVEECEMIDKYDK